MTRIALDNLWHMPFGVRDASDSYPAPVPCLQRRWEFSALIALYQLCKPNRVLEIGTYYGGTLWNWMRHAAITGVTMVSIDLPPRLGTHQPELWQAWAADGKQTLHTLVGPSTRADIVEAARQWAPYDWIFIDGGHAAHEVQADWDTYFPMAGRDAVIALHDILPGKNAQHWIEVEPVWRNIQRMGFVTQELVADPNADWGGIGVVYL
jgi:predicted O-methyltransferase YrrM